MQALVLNITDWISYHIADRLLSEGYEVNAVKSNNNEHLVDFFPRNSNFELVEEPLQTSYPLVICVGPLPQFAKKLECKRIFLINSDSINLDHAISIQAPYLFGEWMPLSDDDLLQNENQITFSASEYEKEGLYIADFLEVFMEWVEKGPPNSEIYVKSKRNGENTGKKLEKTFLVDENVPIEENLKQVISHYQQFKDLYQSS